MSGLVQSRNSATLDYLKGLAREIHGAKRGSSSVRNPSKPTLDPTVDRNALSAVGGWGVSYHPLEEGAMLCVN